MSDWNTCGCWHLGVDHELDGPCTATNCECPSFLPDPLWAGTPGHRPTYRAGRQVCSCNVPGCRGGAA